MTEKPQIECKVTFEVETLGKDQPHVLLGTRRLKIPDQPVLVTQNTIVEKMKIIIHRSDGYPLSRLPELMAKLATDLRGTKLFKNEPVPTPKMISAGRVPGLL